MYLSKHIAWCPKNKRHLPGAVFSRGQNSSSHANIARGRESQHAGRAQNILELGSTLFPLFPLLSPPRGNLNLKGEEQSEKRSLRRTTDPSTTSQRPPSREESPS